MQRGAECAQRAQGPGSLRVGCEWSGGSANRPGRGLRPGRGRHAAGRWAAGRRQERAGRSNRSIQRRSANGTATQAFRPRRSPCTASCTPRSVFALQTPSTVSRGAHGRGPAIFRTVDSRFVSYRGEGRAARAASPAESRITAATSVMTAHATGVRNPPSCQPKSPRP